MFALHYFPTAMRRKENVPVPPPCRLKLASACKGGGTHMERGALGHNCVGETGKLWQSWGSILRLGGH